jgi:hypothetical protein
MYIDLYSYIVYCIWTNSTSSDICKQRWIYGIINKIIIIIIINNCLIIIIIIIIIIINSLVCRSNLLELFSI